MCSFMSEVSRLIFIHLGQNIALKFCVLVIISYFHIAYLPLK